MTHKNTILSCWIYFSISKKEEIDPETSSEWQRKRKDPETNSEWQKKEVQDDQKKVLDNKNNIYNNFIKVNK